MSLWGRGGGGGRVARVRTAAVGHRLHVCPCERHSSGRGKGSPISPQPLSPRPPHTDSNLLGFCAVACLQSGRLSLRAQIMYPLLVILALLASTAGVALRLDLPGTAVAYYIMPTLALLVRPCGGFALISNPGLTGQRAARPPA